MVQAAAAYALNDRQVDIETPEHVSVGYELADMGSRFTALLIDGLILFLGMLGLSALFFIVAYNVGGDATPLVYAVMTLVLFLLFWGYFIFYEGYRDGQTIGKKAMRIRVVQDGGYPMSFRAAAVRNLVRLIDIQPGFTCGVGGIVMMLHPRTKRLGDLAAGTVVIRDRSGQPIPEEQAPAGAAAWGAPRLTDQEYAALSMYIQRRDTLEYAARARLAGTLLERLRPRLGFDSRERQMPLDHYLGLVHHEESGRRRTAGAGGRAGSAQASALFRRQRPSWDEYNAMVEEAQSRGLSAMGEARVSRFAALYREVAADLARARTYGGSPELLFTLERSVGAGHNLLYRAPARGTAGFVQWITGGFPALVRKRWRPIALASLLFYLPAVITFAAVRAEPARGRDLLPPQMMARAENAESRQAEGKGYVDAEDFGGNAVMSSQIMSNNVQVTFLAFAGGILACFGTVVVLIFNGISLGAVAGVFANVQANVYLWSFVLPHGVIELTAICIAGGAGLWLGSGFILPGRMTRREALVVRGREAVSLIGGTAVMLVFAGMIEGFVSPSSLPAQVKLALAVLFGSMVVLYLALAGRGEAARAAAEAAARR
jgi:uncharacterized membrane protein SpoIIM required for sporulation/uncharacterized RDD family membrane protein YckC